MGKINRTVSVVVVGGGQAGLSASYYLCKSGIDHVVLERSKRFHSWKNDRWDSFCLVTPNWQCRLPNWPYNGNDPDGYMNKNELIDYLEGFAKSFNAPLLEGIKVTEVSRSSAGKFQVETSDYSWTASQVILATGSYDVQKKPSFSDNLSPRISQIGSKHYKSPADIPEGMCLVVGTGQSGVQMMEDLWLAGRQVSLSVGSAPRSPRLYRGKDSTDWLYEIGEYSKSIDQQPDPKTTEAKTNHYLSGRDGGHEIDLRKFAQSGLALYGTVSKIEGEKIYFSPDLEANLDLADKSYLRICELIDDYIEKNSIDAPAKPTFKKLWRPEKEVALIDAKEKNITSVIWCTGFTPDYSWLKIDCLDERGRPIHKRGVSNQEGLFFLGLNWLHTWGSGRFLSVADDAEYVVSKIAQKTEHAVV
ncbi:MAG: FAD-dependent oxidoreductase [Opitutae bacterium]|nr:FAD-dependent oxidoreductase [Opitutae bacterium]